MTIVNQTIEKFLITDKCTTEPLTILKRNAPEKDKQMNFYDLVKSLFFDGFVKVRDQGLRIPRNEAY